MNKSTTDARDVSIDSLQSGAYAFPYHYIPSATLHPRFARNWGFAPSYIAALKLADSWLSALLSGRDGEEHRHMDYGCGDGGFVYALIRSGKFGHVRFEGIDIDERAIQWADLFGKDMPNVRYQCADLNNLQAETYDSGSLVEVFEHIPPIEADGFARAVAHSLKVGALLFVTVPSTEKPVGKKHYRHFDFETLQAGFAAHFDVVECVGFERSSWLGKLLKTAMMRSRFYVETALTSDFMIGELAAKHKQLLGCGRICLILRKRGG